MTSKFELSAAERFRIAELAAEYLALVASLEASSPKAEYRRANALSMHLAMVLPGHLYMKIVGAAYNTPENNPMGAAVAMREWTGAVVGELDADADLAWHAPGIGVKSKRNGNRTLIQPQYEQPMLNNYSDIIEKAGPPLWYDEDGVPRYRDFHPLACVLKGAEEAFLVEIQCQGCGTPFRVALTWKDGPRYWNGIELPPAARLTHGSHFHYGDPPNVGCCAAGPTMSSDFVRIIEAWVRTPGTWTWLKLDNEAVKAIPAESEVGAYE